MTTVAVLVIAETVSASFWRIASSLGVTLKKAVASIMARVVCGHDAAPRRDARRTRAKPPALRAARMKMGGVR